jgi:hypothetical protein
MKNKLTVSHLTGPGPWLADRGTKVSSSPSRTHMIMVNSVQPLTAYSKPLLPYTRSVFPYQKCLYSFVVNLYCVSKRPVLELSFLH